MRLQHRQLSNPRRALLRAFTLVELLVVMVVIAVLALIVVPQFASRTTQAQQANIRANLRILRAAIQTYRADTSAWPTDLTTLTATTAPSGVTGWNGPYLTAPLPQDPTVATGSGANGNWTYTNTTGVVVSANSTYSSW